MEIDIILGEFVSPQEAAELGKLAEGYGIRAVWSTNYGDSRDPFLTLSMLAPATQTIRMGPLAVSPMELHPVKMANALLTLNELCGGRSMIAVGGGGAATQTMGLKRTRIVNSATECVEILKRAATGQMVDYEGELYRVAGYQATWAAQPRPQLYVAANRPRMIAMATRLADGIQSGDMTPPMMADVVGEVQRGLAAADRSGDEFRIGNFWAWHIKEDKAAAKREARRELALRGMLQRRWTEPHLDPEECDLVEANRGQFFRAFLHRTHVIDGVPDAIIDKLVDSLSSTGDLTDIDREVDRLHQFASAGATEIAYRLHDDPADAVKIIGERLLPAL